MPCRIPRASATGTPWNATGSTDLQLRHRPGTRSICPTNCYDERVADRGVPSLDGARRHRPLDLLPAIPTKGPVEGHRGYTFDAVLTHAFGEHLQLPDHFTLTPTTTSSTGDVFPGAVDAATQTVAISACNNTTARRNLFNQTDLVWETTTSAIRHTVLAGAEFGRQVTDNQRMTGYFGAPGSTTTSIRVPLASPTTSEIPLFRPPIVPTTMAWPGRRPCPGPGRFSPGRRSWACVTTTSGSTCATTAPAPP